MKHWQTSALIISASLIVASWVDARQIRSADGPYTLTAPSRDGIGRYYFGREIAKVMGHRGDAAFHDFRETPGNRRLKWSDPLKYVLFIEDLFHILARLCFGSAMVMPRPTPTT